MTDTIVPDGATTPAVAPAKRGWFRRHRALTALLVVLSVVVLVAAGYLLYLDRLVSGNVRHADLLPKRNAAGDVVLKHSKHGVVNFLLLGSDAKPQETGARSDVIIIAHISPDRKHVTLVHFPRDLYVDVPGTGPRKLTQAFEAGGVPLAVRVLQNMTGGTRIDRVALLGFKSFQRMTEAVGGVTVTAPHAIHRPPVLVMKAGVPQNLEGPAALAFVRERKQLPQGDVSRGEDQMIFLKALAHKVLQPAVLLNPSRLADLLDAASRDVVLDRDTSVGDLRGLAFALRGLRPSHIESMSAPFTHTAWTDNGRYIILWDPTEMLELGKALRDDTMDDLHFPNRELTAPDKKNRYGHAPPVPGEG